MLSDIMRSAGAGAVFGAALTISRVYDPLVIMKQMSLKDFHMLEVFLTAGATSALKVLMRTWIGTSAVMLFLERYANIQRRVRTNSTLNWFSSYDGNIIGGALIGAGMSLSGACPGTVLVQLAHDVPSSKITALGALMGGFSYARWGKSLIRTKSPEDHHHQQNRMADEDERVHTIASKLHIHPNTAFLAFEILALATITLSTFLLPGRALALLVPPVAGGLLIGTAQAISLLLTGNSLGVSAAYEQLGRYLWRAFGFKDVAGPPTPPKALIFGLGIFLGSLSIAATSPQPSTSVAMAAIPTMQALAGGFILSFGAKMAGGCTSGHGLSGLSALSFSSLITVIAMFGAGIATRATLP